jgi:hypothetical protein
MVASSHNPGLGLGFASRADLDFRRTYEAMADGIVPLQSDDVPFLRIPGIYTNPGGYVTAAGEILRLSMGGEPTQPAAGGVGGAGTASAFPLSKNTVWMLVAAAVAVIVLSRRDR